MFVMIPAQLICALVIGCGLYFVDWESDVSGAGKARSIWHDAEQHHHEGKKAIRLYQEYCKHGLNKVDPACVDKVVELMEPRLSSEEIARVRSIFEMADKALSEALGPQTTESRAP